jgi:hypothetical protein
MRLTRRGERVVVGLALAVTFVLLGFVGWVEGLG